MSAVAIFTAPRWGAGRIKAELERRVGARLGAEVEIAELTANWSGAELHDVTLRLADLDARVDAVHVSVDRQALWSGRVEVVEIEAVGGYLHGSRDALTQIVQELRELEGEAEGAHGWLRRRTRLTPDAVELRGLSFTLRDGDRRATGSMAATVEPAQRRVELRVTSLVAELGLGRPLRAASLRTSLEQRDGELLFPITSTLAGVAAEVDENIAVAGVHGTITAHDRDATEISVDLAGGFAQLGANEEAEIEGGDLWSVSGRFARDLSAGKIAVDMAAFELGRVPEVLASLPVVESDLATLGGHLEIDFGDGVAQLDGKLSLAGLNVSHQLLARDVVRDVGFSVEIDALVDPAARKLSVRRLAVQRAGVVLLVRGELVHARVREQRRYQVDLEIPAVGCQEVLDAIPRELVPGLAGFELEGQFAAHVNVDADFADLAALKLDADIDFEACRVRAAPRLASAAHLNGGFVHRVTMRDGRTRRVGLYAGSSNYTPLDAISRYMAEAVLTTEDGSFRRHDGFNRSQLEVALRRNLESGKVRLGASTITMQMVKNVLLSHERTLSRKLQELFLTWWVEQALSKQRIMELYLNVIEFGPGVYGVTDASRHYFGKHPGELSSLEAAYLASMLPSPVRRHVYYCDDQLSERFDQKVRWIHDLMLERERITAQEHEVYAATLISFDPYERGDPEACLEEIETLMAATQTQRSLSGLLGDGGDTGDSLDAVDWGATAPSRTWGVRPPLPVFDPSGAEWFGPDGERAPGQRLEPSLPQDPFEHDPANSDAPGIPAMDE
ncbi:Monofunctional biosynthetic peptidoglycan transglycosylase [Enhygromyxa salina]|uniref:Monofunctional biosynthetic peptidoglycan transglycosylase n=1 Tax=Enhygromyxa salina TaxID=215803 RepID=A0A0C1ZYT3_9BACT|nr:biosynthetic peptidoglycan transglycosylase [Enhygromyxa salina]KIG16413.1 Monofunctional biosynthetic peptidoglycan transglycosylase [Enhygromyxa salina]